MTLTIHNLAWGHAVPGGSWRQLFEGFSLDCPAGQFVVVIGSNGSGKSTLLNLIAGTLRAGSGSVQLDGCELLKLPDHRRARLIGRVMQNPLDGTAPALTIAENLRLAECRRQRDGPTHLAFGTFRTWWQLRVEIAHRNNTQHGLPGFHRDGLPHA